MATLSEIRQQYPQYEDMPDAKLADALYNKFYTDMPREQFNEKVGLKPQEGFGDRLQKVWDNPTVGGLPWMAKQLVQGVEGSVQASAEAMQPPQTEVDALNQRVGREMGPRFAMDAASLLTPTAPRGAGGVFARPMSDVAVSPKLPASVTEIAGPNSSTRIEINPTLPKASVAAEPSILDAASNIGVGIPKYLESDSMPVQRIAAGLKNIPGAGDKIVNSAQAVTDDLGLAVKSAAEGFGAGSVDVAGGAAKDNLSRWIKSGSQKPVDAAYREVDSLINNEVTGRLENTQAEIAKIMAERANAKIAGKSAAVDLLLPAIQSEGLNYQGAKDLRSLLGDKTPAEMIAQGINPKEAKRLYGPMTKDLESIVEQSGGEAALNKWREANSIASLTASQRKQLGKVIGSKGDATPESVYSRLVSYAGSKSSGDINRLMLARKAMGEDAWSEIASAVISKLGRDAQGNFSPDRYFTAYGNLSKAGKNTLFGSKPELAKSLDDINTVVNGIKDKIGKYSNPSGTAQNLIGGGMFAGLLADPVTLIASIVGGRVTAEILSKPATAKATADFAKAYAQAVKKPADTRLLMDAASRNLANVVGSNIRTVDVQTFLKALQGTVPAPAGNDPAIGREGRNNQPYPNAVEAKA